MSTKPDEDLFVEQKGDLQRPPSTDVYSENVGKAPVVAGNITSAK